MREGGSERASEGRCQVCEEARKRTGDCGANTQPESGRERERERREGEEECERGRRRITEERERVRASERERKAEQRG